LGMILIIVGEALLSTAPHCQSRATKARTGHL
jgi:hypothetical protein